MDKIKTAVPAIKPELLKLANERQTFMVGNIANKLGLLKTVEVQRGITKWEQLVCAGYNPYYRRLEAVVNIKEQSGYNGNLCSIGSKEFVRFFVDFKDGHGFRDMGYTSFKIADISNEPAGPQHPLSYMVYLVIDDWNYRNSGDCDNAVIPTVRAVLSWNVVPGTDPEGLPVYGNRIDADIQLEKPLIIKPIFTIPAVEKLDVIHKLNKAAGILDSRTLYSTLGASINSSYDFSKASSILKLNDIETLNVDLNKFIEFFNGAGKKADVTYEELTCVGLNPAYDLLGAVIHVKKKASYLGNLCSKGSNEHVAFWADWDNNGTFDQYLGTVSINVHDIKNAPDGGLYYSVLMPVDFSQRLSPCNTPQIIRLRAVLSWESLPSTTDPNQLNHYGNYKDALVQLRPGNAQQTGITAALHRVGGAERDMIDSKWHLYNYKDSPYSQEHNRPWGGAITFNGVIHRNGFNGIIKYRLQYKKVNDPDTAYQPVATSVTVEMDDLSNIDPPFADTQADAHGWFVYKQNPSIRLYNVDNYLATWQAGHLADGHYTIKFEFTDELGNEKTAEQFSITLCNRGMRISATANSTVDKTSDLDLVIDGGDCHGYKADAKITGHLHAVHPYLGSWGLQFEPRSHVHKETPQPGAGEYPFTNNATGEDNLEWTLNTGSLDPCGYTVSLHAYTRVILNSSLLFPYYAPKAVGFAKLP